MLLTERNGARYAVTLNRPDVRNAFNEDLIARLTEVFQQLPEGVRLVVLRGNGKTFSAGGDLDWMRRASEVSEEENYQDCLRLAELFRAMATCKAVVVSLVHGAAFGGGAGLVAASDVAIAEVDTKFSFSEARLGLVPATIGAYVLPKIGAGHARALFCTAEVFDAREAHRIGLVHKLAESGELDFVAEGVIQNILKNGPEAVHACKMMVTDGPLTAEAAARLLAQRRVSDEGREGISAFLNKRSASFVEEGPKE
ncbi:MAG TPA: enoyl-CoA hydratase-related protein [Fimbriimonadaceae bacterium]|nr:enoyl-CoA hydratase [Armatimonadota bacterium]HCM73502.1 enoyl-CoA hydratase [Armatimonadota bacterium]HRD31651.1 enoyl-CoA hydratase-related protein [Fimbriimonadaceae bacterium]HRE93383.1 enoyl-CoA hydratase-related protein [Fimbriimonadaceae bacterium]HRI73009.1 enoyl-CoA hydratase-related protein [Fimbriimonadaceae bacterium]